MADTNNYKDVLDAAGAGPGLEGAFETYFVSGLGAATVRVLPAIVVVLFVAHFARQRHALLLAGMLPTLFLPAVSLTMWVQQGIVMGALADHPIQQAFDIGLSLIAGALVGWGAYEIKRRFDPLVPRAPQLHVTFPNDSDERTMGIGAKMGLSVLIFVAGCAVADAVQELYGHGQFHASSLVFPVVAILWVLCWKWFWEMPRPPPQRMPPRAPQTPPPLPPQIIGQGPPPLPDRES